MHFEIQYRLFVFSCRIALLNPAPFDIISRGENETTIGKFSLSPGYLWGKITESSYCGQRQVLHKAGDGAPMDG